MALLRITIEWLDGRYHGEEWPPSPWRLFQAMVAGCSSVRRGDRAFEGALRHLEALPAPVVTAPRAEPLAAVTSRVPNNDGDLVLAVHAKDEPRKARELAAKLVTRRPRPARRFEGVVTCDWTASGETLGHFRALEAIARSVSAVGQGIDLAVARAALLEEPAPARGVQYTPSPAGRLALGVPRPGGFDALQMRYRRERSRIGAGQVETSHEVTPETMGYRCELELPPIRWAAFELRSAAGGRRLAIEGARTMEVAAMVRHAIGCAARSGGLGPKVVRELMGHGGEGRIVAQPLGNVGYRHADGKVRRVLLTAPWCVGEDEWYTVVRRLAGEALIEEGSGGQAGVLMPVARQDPMIARYRKRASTWTSATPVVLAGFDSRRGRPRPGRAVRRLLRHAGVGQQLLKTVTLEPDPRLRGSGHALSYRRPAHLERYPVAHLTIEWTERVRGPLALGLGVGYGLGLFVPVDEDFPRR